MKHIADWTWEVEVELKDEHSKGYKYNDDQYQGTYWGIDPNASSGTGDFGLYMIQDWMVKRGRWAEGEGKMQHGGAPRKPHDTCYTCSEATKCKVGDKCLFRFNDFLLTFTECKANTQEQR